MKYSISFSLGQTIVDARSPEHAESYMRREYGNANGPYRVRQATEEDVSWVESMGGIVHNLMEKVR